MKKVKARKNKDTLILQFKACCKNDGQRHIFDVVNEEFEKAIEVESYIKDSSQDYFLNQVLHATRGLDTSLRTFLEIHNNLPDSNGKHLRGYIKQLEKPKGYRQLNGNIAENARKQIVDKRNIYMHTSGKYPTQGESEYLLHEIFHFMGNVLTLVNH